MAESEEAMSTRDKEPKAPRETTNKPRAGDVHTIQPVGKPWFPKEPPKPKSPTPKRGDE